MRVLIVDDQELIRTGFRTILNGAGIEVVGEASNGREAVQLVRSSAPDVVLMDVRMPQMDGIAATREITALPDPPRVLVLTMFDLDDYVYGALRAGASGFLLKDTPKDQLLHGIEVVARGESLIAPSVTRRLVEEFVKRPPRGPDASSIESLTERESEVLLLMARGLSNSEIARALVVSEATAKTHVAHILMKLGLRDRIQVVIYAYENGLVDPGWDADGSP